MRVWVVTVGEPLPGIDADVRPCRSGLLSQYLTSLGHEVQWWGSTFNHFKKIQLFDRDVKLSTEHGFELNFNLFHGSGYRKNVSAVRLFDHYLLGRKFKRAIEDEPRPDVIVASFPTIELAYEAVRYGQRHSIPVYLDIRDLWPDIFLSALPSGMRLLGSILLAPLFHKTKTALRGATGLIGISQGYLEWALQHAGRSVGAQDKIFPLGYRESKLEFTPAVEQLLTDRGVDFSKRLAWFIGTFGITYDLGPVIDAARRFEELGRDDIQFIFSGDGEKRKVYEEKAKGLRNVVFTGWVDTAQIACLMKKAALGLAAYAVDAPQGLPNKVFEYLSAGLPILSSLEGETAELLESAKCGVNYSGKIAGDFTDKIERLLSSPEKIRMMGAAAQKVFREKFSADVIYPNFVDVLERSARGRLRAEKQTVTSVLSISTD